MRDFEFILEAGVNHNGSKEEALRLVREASATGADFVKFQTYSANKLAAQYSPSYWDLNEEPTQSQVELFSKYDGLRKEDYFDLASEARKFGIGFMTTCFDNDWVDELDEIIPQYKIASADITNFSLLSHVAKKKKNILLSTGAATFQEIQAALVVIGDVFPCEVTLLHCVLNYPTPTEHAALGRILQLKKAFPGNRIGYSDHTKTTDSELAIQIAYGLGARVFEKHFSLTPDLKGNDHYHSFNTDTAKLTISNVAKIESLSSYDEAKFIENQSQARNYARRGLYASRLIKPGEILDENSIQPLRPPIGSDGFGGEDFFTILGRTVCAEIQAGEPIQKNSLG